MHQVMAPPLELRCPREQGPVARLVPPPVRTPMRKPRWRARPAASQPRSSSSPEINDAQSRDVLSQGPLRRGQSLASPRRALCPFHPGGTGGNELRRGRGAHRDGSAPQPGPAAGRPTELFSICPGAAGRRRCARGTKKGSRSVRSAWRLDRAVSTRGCGSA